MDSGAVPDISTTSTFGYPMKRIKLKGGDEYDALTKAKQFYNWKSGERKKIKRGYNKRLRKCAYDGDEIGSTCILVYKH